MECVGAVYGRVRGVSGAMFGVYWRVCMTHIWDVYGTCMGTCLRRVGAWQMGRGKWRVGDVSGTCMGRMGRVGDVYGARLIRV